MRVTLYTGISKPDATDFLSDEKVPHTAIASSGWTPDYGQEYGSVITIAAPDHESSVQEQQKGLFSILRKLMDRFEQKTILMESDRGEVALAHDGIPIRWEPKVREWERAHGDAYIAPWQLGIFVESWNHPLCEGCGLPHPQKQQGGGVAGLALLSLLAKAKSKAVTDPLKDFPDFVDNPGHKGGGRSDN